MAIMTEIEHKDAQQCRGRTKKKTQCTRKGNHIYEGKCFCWQHYEELTGGGAAASDSDDSEESDHIKNIWEGSDDDYVDDSDGGRRSSAARKNGRRKRASTSNPSSQKTTNAAMSSPPKKNATSVASNTPGHPGKAGRRHSPSKPSMLSSRPHSPKKDAHSTAKPAAPSLQPGIGRRESSIEALFGKFGHMNLVDDLPAEQKQQVMQQQQQQQQQDKSGKQYSFFGNKVVINKDKGKFSLAFMNDKEKMKEFIFHRRTKTASDGSSASQQSEATSLVTIPSSLPETTAEYLEWVPRHVSPETAQKLLHELLQPVSKKDVPGYIYMCWVTPSVPEGDGKKGHRPPAKLARSLIPSLPWSASSLQAQSRSFADKGDDGLTILPDGKRISTAEVMRAAGVTPKKIQDKEGRTKECIILKIGRAVDVPQRMKQWRDQCSHTLTLMRYYPYYQGQKLPEVFATKKRSVGGGNDEEDDDDDDEGQNTNDFPTPFAGTGSSSDHASFKIPYCHKVEHLIHAELDEMRVRYQRPCDHCGQKHQEWFEIPAEASQIKMVHECISKWTRWSQMVKEKGIVEMDDD